MDSESATVESPIDIEEVDPDVWLKYEEHYRNVLTSPANRSKVPLLNANALHHLRDSRLVRFRGMIQDMHNPEFYFDTFEIINKQTKNSRLSSGKYRDTADVAEDEVLNYNSNNLKSAERQTMVTISLPGLNEWVQKLEQELNFMPHLIHPASTSKDGMAQSNPNLKRSLDETGDSEADVMETGEGCKDRSRAINRNVTQNLIVSHEHILNFPLPDVAAKVCLMKVYNEYDRLKLNDMVEVVGFLSVDPILGNEWSGKKNEATGEEMDVETLTHNPPPSLVPRIHAVHIETLHHCNPLLPPSPTAQEQHLKEANEAREHLRLTLTELLFGDALAADYLICYLISCVYIRKDVLTLGKFALNLSKIPAIRHPQYSSCLYSILQLMVTKSYYLPLTVENMNTMCFLPKKDYECNRLTSGILQLSKNTHLVLDETKMEPGRLDSTGISNLTALGDMIQTQKVKYDFKYYQMDHDCDIPVLILSEGKSLLPSDFHVPLTIDESNVAIVNEIFEAAKHYLMNNGVLHKVRVYLTSMQLAKFTIEDEPEFIQKDFVEMRNNPDASKQATAEDLHNLLVLTRLVGLSKGVNKLDEECWSIAKGMEEQRNNRLIK